MESKNGKTNGRINTAKTLHNAYFDGDKYEMNFNNSVPVQVDSQISSRYDYAVTDDPELLMERKKTAETIFEIFGESEYSDGRFNYKDKDGATLMRIPRENIQEVFRYVWIELKKRLTISPSEMMMGINEFFDFDYGTVFHKVMSPQMRQEVLEDCVTNGMRKKIEDGASIMLF